MADLEIRAFGVRFVVVLERRQKPVPEETTELTTHLGGEFGFAPRYPAYEDEKWEMEVDKEDG